jgi:hypothetical protein
MKKYTLSLFALLIFTFAQSQNLALSGTAAGSTEGQPAINAIDGNGGTRWESAFSDPQWITVDLGMSYAIGQVILKWEGAFATTYEIQISDDATFTSYTTLYTTSTGDGGIDDLAVSGTGRYVRMYGTERGTPYGYSLWEFEIYEAVDPTTVATLSDLTFNGVTVPGFGSSILDYNIELPIGTTDVPTVVATTSQPSPATAIVTDAPSLPGSTTVLVTAQNGVDFNTYTINFSVEITPINQTFDLTFESGTAGSVASNWNVFENDTDPPFEIVNNPDASGVNTSSSVAKLITLSTGAPWAGCETQHGTIWEWVLDGTTTTITIDVYKTVISDVGVKMVNTTSGSVFEILQPNTITNAWETLTYDISGAIASGENHNVDQIVVFTDWQDPRETNNVSYFDNISWEGLKLADAPPALGISDFETTEFKVYPNPTQNVWNIESNNQIVNSIQIFDMLGNYVMSMNPNSDEFQIDASTFNAGLYLVRIESNAGIKTIKLIKN